MTSTEAIQVGDRVLVKGGKKWCPHVGQVGTLIAINDDDYRYTVRFELRLLAPPGDVLWSDIAFKEGEIEKAET